MAERAGPLRGKAHADDTRDDVLADLRAGRGAMRAIAERHGVSISYVYRLRRESEPARERGRPSALTPRVRAFLRAFAADVRASRRALAVAAAEALRLRGVDLSVATIRREYARLGLPRPDPP